MPSNAVMPQPVIQFADGDVASARRAGASGCVAATLRVGFDARWYNDSGVGTYVAGLLGALVKRPEIRLVTYEDPDNPVPDLDRLSVTRIPVHSPRYSLSAQWEFRRRAREDSLHLFHSPFYDAPLILRCPVVATFHDLIPFLYDIYSWPKRQTVKVGYRIAARRAQQVIAVSQNTAADIQSLLRLPAERLTVVYNAAQPCFCPQGGAGEADWLRSQHNIRQPYFVVASSRNWHTKNLETALRSLDSLQKMTEIKFQTVLYGPPEGFLAVGGEDKSKSSWCNLEVMCLGPVPQTTLAAVFRQATALVMPSLYEGFGLPLVEAMSCGCPVVTSNRGAPAEIAAGGAQLFDPMDYEGMRDALAVLLHDPAARRRWKDRALKRAADFSWDKAAFKTVAAYHRALAST